MDPQKKQEFLAQLAKKEAEANAMLSQTESIVSELIRTRRKKAAADGADAEALAVTEKVIAELIADGREEIRGLMAQSMDEMQRRLDRRA